jgi:hypothetical protein
MRYYDCPRCGQVESITIGWHSDSDGDEMHSRSWEFPEIEKVECGCDLTADQAEAILDDAAKDGPPDYEPD